MKRFIVCLIGTPERPLPPDQYLITLPTGTTIPPAFLITDPLPIYRRIVLEAVSIDEVFVRCQNDGPAPDPAYLEECCRSLSVGDIVCDVDAQRHFVCLSIGWLEVDVVQTVEAIRLVRPIRGSEPC